MLKSNLCHCGFDQKCWNTNGFIVFSIKHVLKHNGFYCVFVQTCWKTTGCQTCFRSKMLKNNGFLLLSLKHVEQSLVLQETEQPSHREPRIRGTDFRAGRTTLTLGAKLFRGKNRASKQRGDMNRNRRKREATVGPEAHKNEEKRRKKRKTVVRKTREKKIHCPHGADCL